MTSIGKELKRERELRGITLKEIADSTKINPRFLEALEEDRFDILPEKFFTLGIIREYAKYIGLDEKSAIRAYEESLPTQQEAQEEESQEAEHKKVFPKFLKRALTIVLMSAVIVAGLALLYYVCFKPENPELIQKSASPLQEQRKDFVLPPFEPQEEIEEGLNFDISFQQETWLRVYVDDELGFTGIKYPGEDLQFKALNEAVLNLGNAGGFTYAINGKPGKQLGSSGEVKKNIRITTDNVDQYLEQDETSGTGETSPL